MDEREWAREREQLETVQIEVRRQLAENEQGDERLKADALETRRASWEDVGAISGCGGLSGLVDFMQSIDVMKQQQRDHAQRERTRVKLERMLASPYFARIDFRRGEEAQSAAKPFYIGISNLIDAHYRLVVCDWRAPVAGMFYDFETGLAFYECPNGVVSGEITAKRQYKISAGKIEYMFDSALKIDDEMLQRLLAKNSGHRMKAIVTSIQREQNRAIRNESYRHLIVRGPAGSGKTSIALHRAAYLLYRHRQKITARNIIIFSPNRIFNDYISGVLPELGEENILQTTFEEYIKNTLKAGFKTESAAQMMERIFLAADTPYGGLRAAGMRWKASDAFREQLLAFVRELIEQERGFPALVFNGRTLFTKKELRALFFEEYSAFPVKRRLEKICEYALSRLASREAELARALVLKLREQHPYASRAELTRRAKAAASREGEGVRARVREMTAFDIIDVYQRFLAKADAPGQDLSGVRADTLENLAQGYLAYEDQAPLVYLEGMLGGWPKTGEIKFVIIDEAQDYTPLQYQILHELFSHANITVLGDPAQAINPYVNACAFDALTHMFPRESTLEVQLHKSYRSTLEIAAFAKRILQGQAQSEPFGRHGEEPVILGLPDMPALRLALLRDVETLLQKGYRSIGILTRTAREARELSPFLRDAVKAVLCEDDAYESGAVVMPVYLAKGLEFDAVLVYEAGGGNYAREEERLLLYTACTRALHTLKLYHTGACSPFLANGREEA